MGRAQPERGSVCAPGEQEISNDSAFLLLFIYLYLASSTGHPRAGLQTQVKHWPRVAHCDPAVWGPDSPSAGCRCGAFLRPSAGRESWYCPDLPLARHLFKVFLAQHVDPCGFTPKRGPAATGTACLAHEQLSPRGCSCTPQFGMRMEE